MCSPDTRDDLRDLKHSNLEKFTTDGGEESQLELSLGSFVLIASEATERERVCDGPVGLWNVGEVDVVVPHAPQTGQDLSEGSHDQVLAVTEIKITSVATSHFTFDLCN